MINAFAIYTRTTRVRLHVTRGERSSRNIISPHVNYLGGTWFALESLDQPFHFSVTEERTSFTFT